MSENTTTELDALKRAHDHYATAIQILTQRVQYYHEEFNAVQQMVAFFTHLKDHAYQAVIKIEPPAKEESKPLVMDLTHVKGEETKTAELN